ncbi:interferon-inducible GTPase 1-like [Mercenaria mercenaria]|uniref:interferon-inducible GTPase 1-like n=1 Tax=Mercenaria mercenaria TaxID=6596 RepID=UPI00234E3BE4|nr:interferon-inducible GTPase 1-like [Mercenaria mercenaria]
MAASSHDELLEIKAATQKIKNVLEKGGLEGLRKEINENLYLWQETQLNVAVTGSSGAGKSTLINVMMGLNEDDEGAAPTGVTETTLAISTYKKENSRVTYWDLPGVGTPNFPKDTYVERAKLKDYDFFILMARSRFTANDAWLAKQIQKLGKRYYFVRSHIGQDIQNYKRAYPNAESEKELNVIRNECENKLKEEVQENTTIVGQSIHLFLIDSFMCESYDYNQLVAALIRETGGLKASILATSISSATQEIIDKKCRGLFIRIQYVSFQSGMRCTVASAEHEMKDVFEHESKYYREVFEIDDDTLKVDGDLFSLSKLDTYMKIKQLKRIDKRLITSHVMGIKESIKHFKKKIRSDLDNMNIGQRNFICIVFNMLLTYMKCMHKIARNLFQNVPIQVAKECAVKTGL